MKSFSFQLSTLTLAVMATLPASTFAQTAKTDSATDPKPAISNVATDDAVTLDVVVVTARLREESLQKVPVSITVLTAKELESTGTYSFEQVTKLQPSVQYVSSNPRNTAVTIRGLGNVIGLTNDGIEPGVGIYVDGVFYARPGSATTDLLDIERFEVLRGPQGTLFGKNTTAGAINITTNAPKFKTERSAELSFGDQGFLQFKGAVNGTIIDKLVAGRLSFGTTKRDGGVFNVTQNEKQNAVNNKAIRGQLLFTPTDHLDIRLAADYSKVDGNAATQVFVKYGPTLRPAATQFPALSSVFNYKPASTNPYDRLVDINSPIEAKQVLRGGSATVNWDLGKVTLTSVSAYRAWDWTPQNDRDFTSLSIRTKSNNNSVQKQWSQELRLASNGKNTIDWTTGLYAFDQKVQTNGVEQWGKDGARWLIGSAVPANLIDGYSADTDVLSKTRSYAAFAQATYHATDRLHFTPGLRHTKEDKSINFVQTVSGGLATTVASQISSKNGIARNQKYAAAFDDAKTTGQFNVAYDLNTTQLVYANYALGFKSGGLNAAGLPTDASGAPSLISAYVKPEKSKTIELGLKSQFLDRRATLNAALYSTLVSDYQANVVDSGPGALRGYLANIERVTVKGVELEGGFRLNNSWNTYAALAYTNGKYGSYKNGTPPLENLTATTAPFDLTGRDLPGVSKWAGSVGAEYTVPTQLFGQAGEAFVGGDWSYRSKWNSDASVSKYLEISGVSLVNLRAGFRTKSGIEALLFVRNAFDKNYLSFASIQAGNSGAIYGAPGDKRSVGVTVKTQF
jgi:iron complex outermembrane receptor protein